jgi:hypothetical protein
VTVALPVPLEPEANEIHAAWLDAVQLHPEGAVTATVDVPAEAPTDAPPGLIVYEQADGAGAGGAGALSA